MKINNYEISDQNFPFIIAEIGINHNGNLDKALELVRLQNHVELRQLNYKLFSNSFLQERAST